MSAVIHSDRRDAGWDMRQAPENYAALVAAQIGSAILSFAAVWLATRMLGSAGYGGVVAIIAASQAIGQLAVNWTAVSLSRYGVQEFVETGSLAQRVCTPGNNFVENLRRDGMNAKQSSARACFSSNPRSVCLRTALTNVDLIRPEGPAERTEIIGSEQCLNYLFTRRRSETAVVYE